jgi:hypothetical protein
MTTWKADPSAGAWVLITGTGVREPWLVEFGLIFETLEDAQRWADEYNEVVDFQPIRLIPTRIGWLRPS